MFGMHKKSRAQVIGEELGEGLAHVRVAASEAAAGAAEALAPRVDAVRDALAPRLESALGSARDVVSPQWDRAVSTAGSAAAAVEER
ncbi:MAG: hypothetical protein H0T85_05215, partial [Geodermatophilaceae bacterium]|nr:hypothetical protein [Geodermatophilaceae bacterium]